MPTMRFVSVLTLALVAIAAPVLAHPGHGIVVDSRGAIYFVDLANESIWVIEDGGLRRVPVDKHLHALFIDADDALYFEDQHFQGPPVPVGDPPRLEKAGTRMVGFWRVAPGGAISPLVPAMPAAYGTSARRVVDHFGNGLTLLRDAAGASYGIAYAEDDPFPRLLRRTPGDAGGTAEVVYALFERRDGARQPVRIPTLQAMAWGRDGSILVTGGGTVRRIGVDGAVEALGGDPLAAATTPGLGIVWQDSLLGVAEGADGNVYAADYGRGVVRRIDRSGNVDTVRYAGVGWSPTGVAVDGEDLLVLESRVDIISPFLHAFGLRGGLGGPRVVRVTSSGDVSVLATVNASRIRIFFAIVAALPVLVALVIWRRARRRIAAAADPRQDVFGPPAERRKAVESPGGET